MIEAARPDGDRRMAGWSAQFGAALMLATIILSLAVTGADSRLMLDSARALALPPEKVELFRLFLLADCFGYYLPLLLVGGYLWRRLRELGGAIIDVGVLCLVTYVMLGLAGAGIQLAVFPQLVTAHSSADSAVRAASETAWLATVWGAQKGLWLMEGPVMALWGIVTGLAMRRQGMKCGRMLVTIGMLYGAMFLLFCLRAEAIEELFVTIGVILLMVWSARMGFTLLREGAE